MDTVTIILIILLVILPIVGVFVGYVLRIKSHEKSLSKTKVELEEMRLKARNEAESEKKDIINKGLLEVDKYREQAQSEIQRQEEELKDLELDFKDRKRAVLDLENKLNIREDSLDKRSNSLDRREENLNVKETRLDDKKIDVETKEKQVDNLLEEQSKKLEEIAQMDENSAREIILNKVQEDMSVEIAQYIKDEEEKAKSEVKAKAKNILAVAIQKYSAEAASENTVSTVSLPVDEMKGRIIGREGRNIRAIESLTGVDLIIDDTPEAVVLSGFDPVRREVAKKALEILVSDGRIHPARIEEVVERCRNEVEMDIREKGEEAVFKTGIGKIHPDLVRLLGRLHYRTSYGQNVLKHSIETAMIAGKLAAEIGENEIIARRAGLLHDIGKAVDHEVEGSHVEIGVELANKYHECKEVVDAIASHHEDVAPKTIIGVLAAAADALSSARPGARSDSLENYTKRLENLEQISNSVKGVQTSYAVQAGREIRVIVNPEEVDDLQTIKIARKIKEEIENKLSYPGTIKVTVIRETRAVDVAK